MDYQAIDIREKLDKVTEPWSPRIIAQMNETHFKVVKLQGRFIWHSHPDTDEAFFVIDGEMRIEFRDGRVDLQSGELFVVPRGVEHRPVAPIDCQVLLVEPAGTVNTGDQTSDLTAEDNVWV